MHSFIRAPWGILSNSENAIGVYFEATEWLIKDAMRPLRAVFEGSALRGQRRVLAVSKGL